MVPGARWSSSRYADGETVGWGVRTRSLGPGGAHPGGEQVQRCVGSRCLQAPCPCCPVGAGKRGARCSPGPGTRMARPGAGGRAGAPRGPVELLQVRGWRDLGLGGAQVLPWVRWKDLELGAVQVLPGARWSSSRYKGGTSGGEQVQWCVGSRCLQAPCPMLFFRWGGVPHVQGAEVQGVEGELEGVEGMEGVEGREQGQASLLS